MSLMRTFFLPIFLCSRGYKYLLISFFGWLISLGEGFLRHEVFAPENWSKLSHKIYSPECRKWMRKMENGNMANARATTRLYRPH